MSDRVSWGEFLRWDPLAHTWDVTETVIIALRGCTLLPGHHGKHWQVRGSRTLLVERGYSFDGASGPAVDGPTILLAALVHDIICTPYRCESGRKQYPVDSYWKRHAIYYRIARAQGTAWFRAAYHWLGLMAFNWLHVLRTGA